ncbi:MAG: uracil-DNA glycosylase [Burkholderiaceae bacterium]
MNLAPEPSASDNRLCDPLQRSFARVPGEWRELTDRFLAGATGRALADFVDGRVADGATVYPERVFRALELTAVNDVRVVILGQDPYHGAGQAQGLAFSVAPGLKVPPSLRNILQEVERDAGTPSVCRDDLSPWARQGVLLLNSVLTVEDGAPQSHAGQGWEALTDALLGAIAARPAPTVFMLWGAAAQTKRTLIEAGGQHLILCANHPSPLAARRPPVPFAGCGHFSCANRFLQARHPHAALLSW